MHLSPTCSFGLQLHIYNSFTILYINIITIVGLFNYSHCGSQHVTIHMEPWGAGSLPRGWWVGLLQYSAIHCYVHLRHWYCWRSRCPGSLSVCLWLRGWGVIVASNTLSRHKKIVDLCICAFSSFSFPGTVFFFFLCFVLTGAAVGDTSCFSICLNPFISPRFVLPVSFIL